MNVCDGFAQGTISYLTGDWSMVTNVSFVPGGHQDVYGHGSGYYMDFPGVGTATTYAFSNTEQYLHIAVYVSSGSAAPIVTFNRSGSNQLSVVVDSAGTLTIRRGGVSGTVLATSSVGAVVGNVWHWFWVDLIADPAAGSCAVYMDGNSTPVATTIGAVNTAGTGTAGWDQLTWSAITAGFFRITDLVTYSSAEKAASFTGSPWPEMIIVGIPPTSDDTNTFNTGGFADVDEVPWAATDYAKADATGQELIFAHLGVAWTPPAVHGIAITFGAERAGGITNYQARLKSGGADVTSAAVPGVATGTFTQRQVMFQANPDAGTPQWNWTTVLALKFGVKTS